jgi:hypothetical protein
MSREAKKFQVFISSTYEDLLSERQAAVQAVLSSGHIPAGMELFTAGDESQMDVIKRWIKESDVYLLILGGRYGSIEPTSGKSYTHLEYEYAVKLEKPYFAVVIKEEALETKVKNHGLGVLERSEPKKLEDFRKLVSLKMVSFFDDDKDIKIAVYETLSEFKRREDIVGWTRADNRIDIEDLTNEVARLSKENFELRRKIELSGEDGRVYANGLTHREICSLLLNSELDILNGEDYPEIEALLKGSNTEVFTALDFFKWQIDDIYSGSLRTSSFGENFEVFFEVLVQVDLIAKYTSSSFKVTEDGKKFHLRLLLNPEF